MDPDDAPPRLRWRLLAWLAGALLLLPVLYVAAVGPVTWWSINHFHQPDWMQGYADTLDPLNAQPQMNTLLNRYQLWWRNVPAPRSWRRQYLVDQLAHLRGVVEWRREGISQDQKRLAALRLRLDALGSRTDLTPEQSREAIQLRTEITKLQNDLEYNLQPLLFNVEGIMKQSEITLQEFDRRKR